MKNQIIATYQPYNQRRYGTPWVCLMTDKGKYDFDAGVGTYTGNRYGGSGGDIVIFDPQEGAVYGYGQKDYRNSRYTEVNHVKYVNGEFVKCDKLGRTAE